MKYVAPEFRLAAFTCPYCNVYSGFFWLEGLQKVPGHAGGHFHTGNDIWTATCRHCKHALVWLKEDGEPKMAWPIGVGNAPQPHVEMPDEVKADYLEARSISALSPRGAAALLRLAIEKLCKHLGEKGKDVNADIGSLVEKGLPVEIQRALDIVRVTGNNAVHPGELRVEDDPEIVASLFGLVNLIVDNRIAEPKRIEAIYDALPERALKGIEARDG